MLIQLLQSKILTLLIAYQALISAFDDSYNSQTYSF